MPFQMLLCSQVHRKFERPWVPQTSSLVCRAFDLSRQWHAHNSLPARVTGSGDTPWSQRGGTSSVAASAVILSAATSPVTGMLDTQRHAGEAVGDYVLYRF